MKRVSILIVDDNDIDCYLLKRELEELDYEIVTIVKHDGKDAIAFFEQYEEQKKLLKGDFPPLLVFLDINMPLMNGLDFLQAYDKLRHENSELKSTIIMMFTSSKNPKDIQSSLGYSFVSGYLVKGEYTSVELKGIIEKLI